ncbi:MAG TPA: hypothetical protein VFK05_13880 [Polyangiaceae bacterium]|nr:hypothetical protein [Polyangiaceae bacterium]
MTPESVQTQLCPSYNATYSSSPCAKPPDFLGCCLYNYLHEKKCYYGPPSLEASLIAGCPSSDAPTAPTAFCK